MPLPVINDVYRCALQWSSTSISLAATNVIHVKKSGSNAGNVATIIDSHVTSAMWGQTGANNGVFRMDVTPLDGTGLTYPFTTTLPTKWKGALSSGDFTPQVAVIIKLATAKRGRSYRGRIYLPWVHETVVTDGLVNDPYRPNMTTAWATFLSAMSGDSCPLQVASYLHSTSEEVIAAACEFYSATQRKRNKRNSTA